MVFHNQLSFYLYGGTNDDIMISNSKIRSHGFLNGNGTLDTNNCIIKMNDNNATLTGNYLYGNHALFKAIIYINAVLAVPALQSRSKIGVFANNYAIAKASGTTLEPSIITVDAGITSDVLTRTSILAYGNNFQNTYGFRVANSVGNLLTVNNTGATAGSSAIANYEFSVVDATGTLLNVNSDRVFLPTAVKHKTVTVNTTYTIDDTTPDYTIFVDTSNNPVTITLPSHDNGRKIIIKDKSFNAAENNITILRAGGTGFIEDYEGDRVIQTNGVSLTLMSDGSGTWYII